MELENMAANTSVALIVGVTGMVGLSIAEVLRNPATKGGPWKVYGAARRPMPTWFPTSTIDKYITLDAMNYDDTLEKLSPLSSEVTHVFWVAIQVRETEESNVSVNSVMLENVINVLVNSSKSPSIQHITLQTGTKYYMGPIFDPELSGKLVSHEPPFREDMPRLHYKNFYYPLEDLVASYSASFTHSIHRTSIIIGASSRSFYNCLLTLSAYAVICKHEGSPFRYFGTKYTWDHFCDMSDAKVIAEQHVWASVTNSAKNQAYNCTNGDVFKWKTVWKVLSEIFDVEFIPFDEENGEFDIIEEMKQKEVVWENIVTQNGLYETKLGEITCFAAAKGVLCFDFQHVSSMNKSREFGFFGYADTFKSIKFWVQRLRDMKIIP